MARIVPIVGVWIGLAAANTAEAFHDGGVGACEGCHLMHGAEGQGTGANSFLLRTPDASSVCLACHSGIGAPTSPYVSSPDGSAMTPGGDFYWLKKSFMWNGGSVAGDAHGHNIVAWDYWFVADAYRSVAPGGGTFPSSKLGCTSCHDPHGRGRVGEQNLPISGSGSYGGSARSSTALGTYRLLGSIDYDAGDPSLGIHFSNRAPVARQDSEKPFSETDTSHVDYGSGMSEWCTNCHPDMAEDDHRRDDSDFRHPVGLDRGELDEYVSSYNRNGSPSGSSATAYWALVPFERNTTQTAQLDPRSTQGVDANSRIMCLTCHRAHASAFRFMGRWDFESELVANSHPFATDAGVTGQDVYYSYYGRDMASLYGAGQRILCEKCHPVPERGYPNF